MNISPYLLLPRRTFEQALADLEERAAPLTWVCPRCGVVLDSPESAEGCRDFQCPAHTPEAA